MINHPLEKKLTIHWKWRQWLLLIPCLPALFAHGWIKQYIFFLHFICNTSFWIGCWISLWLELLCWPYAVHKHPDMHHACHLLMCDLCYGENILTFEPSFLGAFVPMYQTSVSLQHFKAWQILLNFLPINKGFQKSPLSTSILHAYTSKNLFTSHSPPTVARHLTITSGRWSHHSSTSACWHKSFIVWTYVTEWWMNKGQHVTVLARTESSSQVCQGHIFKASWGCLCQNQLRSKRLGSGIVYFNVLSAFGWAHPCL